MMKTIVITGGTKGIGFELVKIFSENNYKVITCGRSSTSVVKFNHENIYYTQANLESSQGLENFIDFVNNTTNKLDILLHNAGVFLPGQLLNEAEGIFEKLIDLNLKAPYIITRKLIDLIRKSEKGQIYTICSVASIRPYIDGGSYCISKFGLLGFTKVLREELKNTGIKVTAVMPGATLTDSWEGVNLPPERFIASSAIARNIFDISQLPPGAVVEEIIIRPQEGDI